jgi:aldehyde:ferredoxin oxidoreductase
MVSNLIISLVSFCLVISLTFGYNGKRLVVDLTGMSIKIEEPREIWYRKYLGGMGSVAYHLLKMVEAKVDPLGPENILIMSNGVITGAPFSGSGRNAVGGKSPLTGGFGEADAGGFWNAELKHAGFDEIIFTGRAPEPVWLWVSDGKAEIMDGSSIWGLEIGDCHDSIREKTGEKQVKTALIGPAGEKLARTACIINDLNHVAGRCGLGAVMGSKNLKGVAVRGRNPPDLADLERVRELAMTLIKRIPTESRGLHEYGTGAGMDAGAKTGNLPTHNFRDGAWPHASKIDAIAVKERYRVGMGTCYSCGVRCKKEVEIKQPFKVEKKYGGPEYETLGAFGSDCGVSDLAAICKANELCQRYGVDTIGAGTTIAFAMECYEEGIIDDEVTGGIKLEFGNADAMLRTVKLICRREGIGDLLADGSKRASDVFGEDSRKFLVEVKGQEVPMHEPRYKRALGLGYAVSPTGADHMHNMHDTGMRESNILKLRPIGEYEMVPIDSFGPDKVRLFKSFMQMRILANCLCICMFPPWRVTEYRDLVQAVTGWDISMHELVQVAERTLALARIFNINAGFTPADDWLPPRFFQPQTSGALSDTSVNANELKAALKTYYEMMGWDSEGVPLEGTLHRLSIGWATKFLKYPRN